MQQIFLRIILPCKFLGRHSLMEAKRGCLPLIAFFDKEFYIYIFFIIYFLFTELREYLFSITLFLNSIINFEIYCFSLTFFFE